MWMMNQSSFQLVKNHGVDYEQFDIQKKKGTIKLLDDKRKSHADFHSFN